MSVPLFIVILVVGIAGLVFMLVKLKWHPVWALFVAATFFGLALGNDIVKTMSLINSNFGSTLAGIGVVILVGCIMAIGVQDTGCTMSICNFFIRLFRGKHLELAPSLTSFIMAIPVFGDIVGVLTAPIVHTLAKRRHISMTLMTMLRSCAGSLTHGCVPPTPGILAVCLLLGANLGQSIIWGTVISAIAFFAVFFLFSNWAAKEYVPPLEGFCTGVEEVGEDAPIEELLIDQTGCPGAAASFAPILLPVLAITIGSVLGVNAAEGSALATVCAVLAEKTVALLIGLAAVIIVAFSNKKATIRRALVVQGTIKEGMSKEEEDAEISKASLWLICFEHWPRRALSTCYLILLITAMGGAMGGILKAAPVVLELGQMIAETGIMPAFVPFILAAVLMAASGSQTVASMTGAGIVAPMMPILGISPVLAALSLGIGSLVGWHLNNSGFWNACQFGNINAMQCIKYCTLPNAVAGVVGFIALWLLSLVGVV